MLAPAIDQISDLNLVIRSEIWSMAWAISIINSSQYIYRLSNPSASQYFIISSVLHIIIIIQNWMKLKFMRTISGTMCQISMRQSLILILFGMLAPTMDQISDLNLVIRLMMGPGESTHLNTNIGFPTSQWYNVTFKEQPPTMKQMYTAVSKHFSIYVYQTFHKNEILKTIPKVKIVK